MYCLHGTDTKEEMHHHLCNFHSNQLAKVIIRATSTAEVRTVLVINLLHIYKDSFLWW